MRYHALDPETFMAALEATRPPVVLDVRTAAEFERGHVPGSIHLPVHDLPKRRADLPARLIERLLVVGATRARVEAAANFLALLGFADISILEGGIDAYPGELETGPPPPPRPAGPELRITP